MNTNREKTVAIAASILLIVCGLSHAASASQQKEETAAICLPSAEAKELGIRIEAAGPGKIGQVVTLTGEIKINRDRMAQVVGMVPGVVERVDKYLGDEVEKGEVMAVVKSLELAAMKSEYLAAVGRLALAKASFEMEELLWKKKISPQQDYLVAKQEFAAARIAVRAASQQLMAIGYTADDLERLRSGPDTDLARYAVKAPLKGTVIEKAISAGEAVERYGLLFTIADLSTVWVDLAVHQRDLPLVRPGLPAVVETVEGHPLAQGEISYVGPVVSEETRTAVARIVLGNPKGRLRPGTFVTALVTVDWISAPVVINQEAVQTMDGVQVVFVETPDGFEKRIVETGASDGINVEIKKGLRPGEKYVSRGGFTLKCELQKELFEEDH